MQKFLGLLLILTGPSLLAAVPVSESFKKLVNTVATDVGTVIKETVDTVMLHFCFCNKIV